MTNKETQDMTGTGRFIELPDKKEKDDPEPERYWDWMMWKMRQEIKEKGDE